MLALVAAGTACGDDESETPAEANLCEAVTCRANERCEGSIGECVCELGFTLRADGCVPVCEEGFTQGEDGCVPVCEEGFTQGEDGCVPVCKEGFTQGEDGCVPLPCEAGSVDVGEGCEPIVCNDDSECDDGNACNGAEICNQEMNRCEAGEPISCGDNETCSEDTNGCSCLGGFFPAEEGCLAACPIPSAPTLDVLPHDEPLRFHADGLAVEVAVLHPSDDPADATYETLEELVLSSSTGPTRVLARVSDSSCVALAVFDSIYDVQEAYSLQPPKNTTVTPPADHLSTAIHLSDERLVAWATGFSSVDYGEGVSESMQVPERALGSASSGVLPLGHGGSITLSFDAPIVDGDGYDFAVFENGFFIGQSEATAFLELAFVEVSSDGMTWVRFDSASRWPAPVGPYAGMETTTLGGLAGKYVAGFGTPFDLAMLRNKPEVLAGLVDLDEISFVRIIDVVGDGSTFDSWGRPVYQPYKGTGSAGFDLTGVAVIHSR